MSVSFLGLGRLTATFEARNGVGAGMPVKMIGNGKVAPCEAGDDFVGIASGVREGFCAVQLQGYVEVPCSGTLPAPGTAALAADGQGGVKSDAAGRVFRIFCVDAAKKTVGIWL